jgi:hypothetical protein
MAVCRHLDTLVADNTINAEQTQIVLLVLRFADEQFLKAITMFDLRGPRSGPRKGATMPRTARAYLAGIEMYG